MSLLMSSCYGYSASSISGIPSTTTKVALVSWVYVPSSITNPGLDYRGLMQLTYHTVDSGQDHVSVGIDGSDQPGVKTRSGNTSAAQAGSLAFWQSANQDRWMLVMGVFDQAASAADVYAVYGRAAATAIAATTTAKGGDAPALSQALDTLFVGRDDRYVTAGGGTTLDNTSGIKIGESAIFIGSIPTSTDVQSMIDGTSPADISGCWEHWRFRNSTDGLVGRMRGITLAPFGGSATTAWDGATNPTVSDPSAASQSQAPRSMQQFMMRQ